MKNYDENKLDPEVIPLVEYFNRIGLPTRKGHDTTNISMFDIEFHIVAFQRSRTDEHGGFCCNGRFVMRILANATGVGAGVEYTYQHMAATVEAANQDLERWRETL